MQIRENKHFCKEATKLFSKYFSGVAISFAQERQSSGKGKVTVSTIESSFANQKRERYPTENCSIKVMMDGSLKDFLHKDESYNANLFLYNNFRILQYNQHFCVDPKVVIRFVFFLSTFLIVLCHMDVHCLNFLLLWYNI